MKLVVETPSPLAAAEKVTSELVRGPDFGCVWHHHPECEITLVIRGGTERFVGDQLTPLKPGDLVFLGPDLPHDFRNHQIAGKRRIRVEAIVVQFPISLLGEDWLKSTTMERVRVLFERSRRGLHVTGITAPYAAALLEKIHRSHGLRRIILLLELIEVLAASNHLEEISSPGFQLTPQARSSDRIGTACAQIESNLHRSIYLKELAQMSGLSENAFSRLFKSCTTRTVPQYINEMRIARACRLLAETDQTVSQIAGICGFVSPAHFQRQFRKYQKRSPLNYRRAVRATS